MSPAGVDYTLLAYDPSEVQSVQRFGWDEVLGPPRLLKLEDFGFSMQQMEARLKEGVEALYSKYNTNLGEDGDVQVETLDPTQLVAYSLVAEWSSERA